MSVLVEFSMSPLDRGESLSKHVARILEVIDASGVPYQLGPMGTCLEGEWDEVFGVIKRCYEEMRGGSRRITCSIKVDARQGGGGRLSAKVARLEQILGRELKTEPLSGRRGGSVP